MRNVVPGIRNSRRGIRIQDCLDSVTWGELVNTVSQPKYNCQQGCKYFKNFFSQILRATKVVFSRYIKMLLNIFSFQNLQVTTGFTANVDILCASVIQKQYNALNVPSSTLVLSTTLKTNANRIIQERGNANQCCSFKTLPRARICVFILWNKDWSSLLLLLVIIKGYRMRAKTIEGQNAFAPSLCVTDRQNTRDQITSDRRSKHPWSNKLRSVLSVEVLVSLAAVGGTLRDETKRAARETMEVQTNACYIRVTHA